MSRARESDQKNNETSDYESMIDGSWDTDSMMGHGHIVHTNNFFLIIGNLYTQRVCDLSDHVDLESLTQPLALH